MDFTWQKNDVISLLIKLDIISDLMQGMTIPCVDCFVVDFDKK